MEWLLQYLPELVELPVLPVDLAELLVLPDLGLLVLVEPPVLVLLLALLCFVLPLERLLLAYLVSALLWAQHLS